ATGWTVGGVLLSGATGDQYNPVICTDGAAGAIIEWSDYRSDTDGDVYAMRVRSTGALANGWHQGGETICTATGTQEVFSLMADGSGGAISSWADFRGGDGTSDIYVQKVTSSGAKSWTTNGAAICTAANFQTDPSLCPDGAGGLFIAWHDRRSEVAPTSADLFLHHVSS